MTQTSIAQLSLLAGLALAAGAACAQQAPTPRPPAYSAEECAVWAREASFAQSVEDHDAKAFAEHLHADASFITGRDRVARGHAAVIAEWTPLIQGKDARIHWYPDAVTVAGDTGVAVSRGPYWIENPAADARERFVAGRFISTWLRDAKGTWHVLYDGGGGGNAKPATAEEIEKLKAGRKSCPRG
jgi:ketosteroid isomerase-like protein